MPGVHPRVGGGTILDGSDRLCYAGPSPRGRGNLTLETAAAEVTGSIPAWAGEPSKAPAPSSRSGVHPRVGGGTWRASWKASRDSGPSPRGRGNRIGSYSRIGTIGSIPAWAGEPRRQSTITPISRVHPRVGGGTCQCLIASRSKSGPSPRGRGNLFDFRGRDVRRGSIPAWAGEPAADRPVPHRFKVHPRVGGGTVDELSDGEGELGPSPRGRGNRSRWPSVSPSLRSIPAWAGEPACPCRGRGTSPVHPRVGGGTVRRAARSQVLAGPSPRGRGNLHQRRA